MKNFPTSRLTFTDLIKQVAIFLGWASYAGTSPAIPTDTHDLARCKELVNLGLMRFYNNEPPGDSGWKWRHRIMSVTFDADGDGPLNHTNEAYRYIMPYDFNGAASGDIRYQGATDIGVEISWCHESRIRELREVSVYTGYVTRAAIRPVNDKLRYEMLVYPDPQTGHTVEFQYESYFNNMVELNDASPAGFEHDATVLAICLAQAELDELDMVDGPKNTRYMELLQNSWKKDGKLAPRTLGKLKAKRTYRDRTWEPITYPDS